MQCFISKNIKTSSLPPNLDISLEFDEEQIFLFLRSACDDIGSIIGNKPTLRVAGGWVRDKLLGKNPKDIDITVDIMGGSEFSQWLYRIAEQRYGSKQRVVTEAKSTEERPDQIKNLSVAFLRIFDQDVEILPLRGKEVYVEGDRNPISTEVATAKEDAYRRDLTVNSMFYNINSQQIEDFTGHGYDDLITMTLRTPTRQGKNPYSESMRILSEDPLRLLRVLRFNARYPNSQIAPELLEAMKNPDIHHQIIRRLYGDKTGGIVPERTSEEFRKIMTSIDPEKAIRTMYTTGLLQKILLLPSSFHPLEMDQMNKNHELNVLEHTLQVLKNVNTLSQEFKLNDEDRMKLNFTALFHDVGKLDPRSHKIKENGERGYFGDPSKENSLTHQQSSEKHWILFAKALKLSDNETKSISDMVLSHMNPHTHKEGVVSDKQLRKYIRKNPSWAFQYIHAMADAMAKTKEYNSESSDPYRTNFDRLQNLSLQNEQQISTDLLKGPEIIQIVGLPPKPPVGVVTGYIEIVKEIIREYQDDNPQLNKNQATQIVNDLTINGKNNNGQLAPYFAHG